MSFHLDNCRLDHSGLVDGSQHIQGDIRKADGAALAAVHKFFHGSPRLEQGHAWIVEDFALLIARVMLVPRSKREWGVAEIEIQIVQAEPVQTCLESRFYTLGPMIGVPQLSGNEDI